jgi:hypothetical protein
MAAEVPAFGHSQSSSPLEHSYENGHQRTKSMRILNSFLLAGCLMWAGCTTPSGGSAPIASKHYSQEVDKLVITVQPLTTGPEVRSVFGANILQNGVLPIRISTDNQNGMSSFIVPREKIVVMNGVTGATSSSARGTAGREVGSVSAGQALGGLALAGAGPLLILAVAATAKDSVDPNVEHNLTGKEFFTRTLGPGQRANGYIYCKFQKGKPPEGAYRIVAEVKNSATGATIPVEFDINIQITKP